ncbi:single-stranded DNA-binding protein [Shewanella algae]|uniref:single-stranded DNA-binding protein n=1 Tax=Shewanella algae TaxID=38313 RepID=UPI001022090E|nr:single-stranded DNA-binding protein [Shewanella algae]QTE84359.1 hypothetical protein JKK46_11190 [Shewanella algae]QTE84368.1 hypothetical protein JKK46_11235 [Shewanella algae]
MLKIELIAPECNAESRTFEARDGKPARTKRWQVAWAHLGGRFPVQIQVLLEDGQPEYAPGEYQLCLSNFKVNQYQSLELGRFATKLVPLKAPLSKAV